MQMDVSAVSARVTEPFRWRITAPERAIARGRRGGYRMMGGRGVSPVLAARWEAIDALESIFRALMHCLAAVARPHAEPKPALQGGIDGQDRGALMALLAAYEPPDGRDDTQRPSLN
ncbi:MAG: hypothetical protein ACRDF8_01745 [Chloroflexota bacterium]